MAGNRECSNCSKPMTKPSKQSWDRWNNRVKFCSVECRFEGQKKPIKERPNVQPSGETATIVIGKFYVIVDMEYAEWLAGISWHFSTHGYAINRTGGANTYMHHLVAGKPVGGLVTDHINRDKLDNRTANLRHVTNQLNMINTEAVDKAKYYCWDSNRDKWLVYVRQKFIGRYATEAEAVSKLKEVLA